MNKKQILVAVAGIAAMGMIYYVKFVVPTARLKRDHPEIFAANPPAAVVGGTPGVVMLLAVLVVTGIIIARLKGKN